MPGLAIAQGGLAPGEAIASSDAWLMLVFCVCIRLCRFITRAGSGTFCANEGINMITESSLSIDAMDEPG